MTDATQENQQAREDSIETLMRQAADETKAILAENETSLKQHPDDTALDMSLRLSRRMDRAILLIIKQHSLLEAIGVPLYALTLGGERGK